MLEAVVLGVVGVLHSRELATRARIESLCRDPAVLGPAVKGADSPLRQILRQLASGWRLAFLDDGDPVCMDRWLERLGVTGIAERCLWTESFGRQARLPSPYAFRWLAQRFELRPSECLYVAGTETGRRGATAAGWNVLGPAAGERFDLESLGARLATPQLQGAPTVG